MKKLLLLTTFVLPGVALAGNVDVIKSETPNADSYTVMYGAGTDVYIDNHSDKEFLQVQVFSPKQYVSKEESLPVNDSIFLNKDNEFTWKLDCLSSVHPMASCKIALGDTDVGKYVDDKHRGKGPFGLPRVDKQPLSPYVGDNMRRDALPPPPPPAIDLNDKKTVQELTLTTLTRTVKMTGNPEDINAFLANDKSAEPAAQEHVKKGGFVKNPMAEDADKEEAKKVDSHEDFDAKLAALKADLDAQMAEYKAQLEAQKAKPAEDIKQQVVVEEKINVEDVPDERIVKTVIITDKNVIVPVSLVPQKTQIVKDDSAEYIPGEYVPGEVDPSYYKNAEIPPAPVKLVKEEEKPAEVVKDNAAEKKPAKAPSKAKAKKQGKGKVSLKKQFAKIERPAVGPSVSAKPDLNKKPVAEPVKQVKKQEIKPEPVAKTEVIKVVPEKVEPSKILIQKNEVKAPEVVAPKAPTLDINEQLYIALAKLLGGREIEERLEGLRELGYIANLDKSVHGKIVNALFAFLYERASFSRSVELALVPKTDIEQALMLLSRLDLGGRKVILKNLDFSGIQISGVSFKNADFSDCGFVEAKISDSDFTGSSFVGADFSRASLSDVKMVGANLSAAYFAEAFLKDVNFKGANLSCSVFKAAKIISCNFSDTVATSVWFAEAKILNSSFLKSDLSRSDFGKASVLNNNFTAANLDNVNFIGSQHRDNNFTYANFKETFVKGVDLGSDVGITLGMLLSSVFDKGMKAPASIADAFAAVIPQELDRCVYTTETCKARLAPVTKNYTELTNVSVKVLNSSKSNMGQRNWAVCNIACVMHEDKELGATGIETLASLIKRERPWPAQSNRQSIATELPSDVGAALYVIGHRPDSLKGMPVDLTKTDLHKVDFYGYDMTGVNFTGSNLMGSSTTNSVGLPDNINYIITPNK